MRCKQCNDELAITERHYCNRCHSWLIESAPAQEEKEMREKVIIDCAEYEIDSLHDCCTADLRERWDRAYFAALTGYCANPLPGVAWEAAQGVANETVRRWADMMAARDKLIAEVVG